MNKFLKFCLIYVLATNGFSEGVAGANSTAKNVGITLEPLTFNPTVDKVDANDSRIKALLYYPNFSKLNIRIVYYTKNNFLFVSNLQDVLAKNKVRHIAVSLEKTQNLLESNLVKIYLGKGVSDD